MEYITYRDFESYGIVTRENSTAMKIYELTPEYLSELDNIEEKFIWSFFDFQNPETRYIKNGKYTQDVAFYIVTEKEHNNEKGSIHIKLWPEE